MPAVQEQVLSPARFEKFPFLRSIAAAPNKITIAIGGNVDTSGGDMNILTTLADFTDDGTLFVASLASDEQSNQWIKYSTAFDTISERRNHPLRVEHIDMTDETITVEEAVKREGKKDFLLTGGKQNLLKERLGAEGMQAIRDAHEKGSVVAGTSAGAAILGPYMIVGDEKTDHFDIVEGLGLVNEVIVDQHFSQKQRAPRLKKATQIIFEQTGNSHLLAVGVDEDTAVVFVNDEHMYIIGINSVTIFDAEKMDKWDEKEALTEDERGIHVLSSGEIFDLQERRKLYPLQDFGPIDSGGVYQAAA